MHENCIGLGKLAEAKETMNKTLIGLILCFVMGLTNLTLADTTSSGATTNSQTNTTGSNTAISGGYSQESTTTYQSGSSSTTSTSNTTNAYTGDQRVVNSSSAPSMSAMSQDLCVVGISAGVSKFGIGISGGTYRTDENCERIKLSKVLNDLGMKVAAVSILCQDERVFHAMIQSGTPCPYNGKIGNEALKEWQKYDKLRPDYEQYTADLKYIEKKNKKLEKEYEQKMAENAEELTKQQIELDAVAAEKQKLIDEMNNLKGVKTEKKSLNKNNSPK